MVDWYYFHPGFLEELLQRIRPDTVDASDIDQVTWRMDAVKLMRDGHASSATHHRGRLTAVTTIEGVLAGGYLEPLRRFVETHAFGPDASRWTRLANVMIPFLQSGDRARSIERALREPEGGAWIVIFLARTLEAEAEARGYLNAMEANLAPYEAARCWLKLLGDERAARRCLGDGCPEGWMHLFGDESRARALLEDTASPTVWKRLFNDDAECRRRLEDDALGWMDLYGDRERARSLLRRQEDEATQFGDWRLLAWRWSQLFGDEENTRKCLEQGEALIARLDVGDWETCAQMWKDLLRSDRDYRRCWERYEVAYEEVYD
ncbi:hypothetical protein JYT83_01300 [bacterium AH-315-F18]|nr:hypothetical protein [bacterium AH-315-F18]